MTERSFLVDRWPKDLFLFRHAEVDRDDVPRPDLNDPDWYIDVDLIDMYQELREGIGFRQGKALGRRLASTAFLAEFCLSTPHDRGLQTAWEVVSEYPEHSHPTVLEDFRLQERNRGLDHPILISKEEFYRLFPEQGRIRDTTPSKWQPRGGETYENVQNRFNALMMQVALERPYEEQLLISTSGEVCITAFNNPLLGNMDDEQLVQGFGEGMPATQYEFTALTHYTKRDPFDLTNPYFSDTYDHMRVISPIPQEPEQIAWDTGWLQIEH